MKSAYDYLPAIDADTAAEMAEQAGLDFDAIKLPIPYEYQPPVPDGILAALIEQGLSAREITEYIRDNQHLMPKKVESVVPDKVIVVREDDGRYLGTVGKDRGIVQYRDVLAFTETLVDEGTASYVTGGILGNGEQAFVVMKAKKQIKLSGTDEVDLYFYVTTSHDSSKGLEIVFAPLRKVNGTILTGTKAQRIRFRHSSKVEQRVKQATLSVNKITSYFEDMEENFRLLRSVRPTATQLDVFLKSLFPDPEEQTKRAEKIRDEIYGIYKNGAACNLPATRGTMLGVYFAVVEWVDKLQLTKASKVRPNEYDAKIHRLLEGSGAEQKATAYTFALDMVDKLGAISIFGNNTEEK
jgi:phage/plasmid-like protein (TIGR03299 family)